MYEVFEQLLQKFNVTTYQVSKATGIGQSTFSNWKTRRNLINSETGKKIANYFGVTLDYLITGKEEPEEKKNPYSDLKGEYLSYAKEAQESGISPEELRLAIDIIKKIRGEKQI